MDTVDLVQDLLLRAMRFPEPRIEPRRHVVPVYIYEPRRVQDPSRFPLELDLDVGVY